MFNNHLLRILLSCAIASLMMGTSYSQQWLTTEGKAIVNEDGDNFLLRGMGLGGWMLQEGYMLQTAGFAGAQYQIRNHIEALIGEERTQEFYDAWLANHVTEDDIIALKSWGFNSVRLPMHYNLFTLPIQDEPIPGEHTWLDTGFELTDQLIDWCKTHGLYVVLDLHAAPGGQGYDQGISDYNPDLPSLWESEANQDKMVALWGQLADRYKDEPWVAGYDLLNEPNWDLGQNQLLREVYVRCTEAIRAVDDRHIIFIEGNWFANDFNGLTPPWDDNLVYSPHKYWSFNDQASIQWVLNLRDAHNVPLYLGESGENSNVWFRDAIKLLEDFNIGWAWWPMKKVESIAGPLSVEKTDGYQTLLDYWNGNAPLPNSDDAYASLMDLTEKLKFSNCREQPDVIDAMFRQLTTDETLPFAENEIPGVVYASDFDLGRNEHAYFDNEHATYHVSTNNFTAWNNGWIYRNDGVDLEICEDNVSTNGYNVGWIDDGEWMKYTCAVTNAGVYDVHLRVATAASGGRIFFEVDNSVATDEYVVPNTGDYQGWQTMVIPGIVLQAGTEEITCHFPQGNFNLSSMEFKYSGSTNEQLFRINNAVTLDQERIDLQFNKAFDLTGPLNISDFDLTINGESSPITEIVYADNSQRTLIMKSEATLRQDHQIRVSYQGSILRAVDNTLLQNFVDFFVQNTLDPIQVIPGIIQAENFAHAEGIELEDCLDLGQGQNIGYLDAGDYLEYQVRVDQTAPYRITYRIASENTSGMIRMTLIDTDGQATVFDEPSFPITNGWQVWQSLESEAELEEGHYTLRVDILNAPFNMNWIEFESLLIVEPPTLGVFIYPNPVSDKLTLEANFSIPHQLTYFLHDTRGRLLRNVTLNYSNEVYEVIDVSDMPGGVYYLNMMLEDGTLYDRKIFVD